MTHSERMRKIRKFEKVDGMRKIEWKYARKRDERCSRRGKKLRVSENK